MLLYTALIGYLWQEALEEDRNFATLIDMIGSMQTREDNEDFRNPIDLMFEDLEREKPDCFAVRQYKKFKLAAGKTKYEKGESRTGARLRRMQALFSSGFAR